MSIFFDKTYQRAFGTYPLRGDDCRRAIEAAIETGYRAFDTAQAYANEAEVGDALAESGVPRDELCIVTKVDVGSFHEAKFLPSVEQSLKDLHTDCVDVLFLHWPTPGGDIAPSLRLLQQARERGLARHIGVSNYTAQMMRDAKSIMDAPIAANQVEFHPLLNQATLLNAAAETGIPLSSYCSVARGKVFDYPLFAEIGRAYDKSAAQVVLRWILQQGVALNTMSTKQENIRANFDILDFNLSADEMARIDALTTTNYRVVDKAKIAWAPDWD